ncbi:DNA-directed RNA polymerase subunit beta [Metasolibacillus meyeri]|uniref:DNA-directed RNA polymerase subunit beta n=1 Tax=Metasolibacillus meyeri TaxID=1071052 RepID=A0AAW9NS69_9BACL|nr:DNA-directed RNA polymerase subunit beta [Metasolibacillus meyeri]MEC1177723.1 DNA-directed RNA polymerase subunit beta [Metasolibacillus meyeri]
MTNEFNEQDVAPKKRSRRSEEAEPNERPRRVRWVQIRLIPIWLRIVLVLALLAGAAIGGVMFGYGFLGGGEPSDALKWSTWQHIFDIIEGQE